MSYIRVEIYRASYLHGMDCSNGGISSTGDHVYVSVPRGYIEEDEIKDPERICVLEKGPFGTIHAVPRDIMSKWTMAGGTYIGTSDSRFTEACEALLGHTFYGLVALHDRVE